MASVYPREEKILLPKLEHVLINTFGVLFTCGIVIAIIRIAAVTVGHLLEIFVTKLTMDNFGAYGSLRFSLAREGIFFAVAILQFAITLYSFAIILYLVSAALNADEQEPLWKSISAEIRSMKLKALDRLAWRPLLTVIVVLGGIRAAGYIHAGTPYYYRALTQIQHWTPTVVALCFMPAMVLALNGEENARAEGAKLFKRKAVPALLTFTAIALIGGGICWLVFGSVNSNFPETMSAAYYIEGFIPYVLSVQVLAAAFVGFWMWFETDAEPVPVKSAETRWLHLLWQVPLIFVLTIISYRTVEAMFIPSELRNGGEYRSDSNRSFLGISRIPADESNFSLNF